MSFEIIPERFDPEAIAAVRADVNAADIPILVNVYENNGFVVAFLVIGHDDALHADRAARVL